MFSETVNPANGSLSVRVQVPVPKGRGLTLPFSFAYDSNGAFGSIVSVAGQGTFINNPEFLSQGGWSYSVPLLSASEGQKTEGKYSCPDILDYVFQDPLGTRHALYLASVYSQQGECAGGESKVTGGDDIVQASLPGCATSGYTNSLCYPVAIADADGTTYLYTSPLTHMTTGSIGASLPYQVEDRNGNELIFTDNNGGAFTVSDTLGRTVLSSSGFGASRNTLTVSGLSAYTVNWTTTNYDVASNAQWATGEGSQSPECRGMNNATGTNMPVISSIVLPNGQEYQFFYDPNYGLINEIIYPNGMKVTYTWGQNSQSEFTSFTDEVGNLQGCMYNYDTAAISDRYVYYDGSTLALHQHFTYPPNTSTVWNNPSTSWATKQTIVTTYDLLRGQNFQTTYNYTPVTVPNQWYDPNTFANQIPVESSLSYTDWGGSSAIRTVNKNWLDQYLMQGEQIQNNGTVVSDQFFLFGSGAQITAKYECGSGQSCYNATQSSPPTAYTRLTTTQYKSFAATPIYTAGPSIFDRPASVVMYDGSGSRVAETDYGYDGYGSSGLGQTSGVANHDYTNYSSSYTNRGNPTSISKWLNTSGSSLTWNYTYDDTGQELSMADPLLNSTSYSYTDEFPACNSPSKSTNAYLTKITDAKGFTQNFTYRYCDGQLNSATDRNSQTTSYSYVDSLNRLKGISSPDGGSTTYGYGSNFCAHPSSTTILLSGSTNFTETATLDGACRVTNTTVTSDPSGNDLTDTTYDGMGRVWTVSNPYRSKSETSYGVTTYTYDSLGRMSDEGSAKSILYPDGGATSTTIQGLSTTIIDPAGKTRTLTDDNLGRLASVNEAGSYTTSYTYDALDNLLSVLQGTQLPGCTSNGNSVSRSFVYDSLSRLTSACNPESGTTTYTYDANGNVLSKEDASGRRITYCPYDALNRITCKTYSDTTPTANFAYDETSVRLTGWNSPTLAYPIGRLTHTTTMSGSTLVTATVQDYDKMGRTQHYWQCTPSTCGVTALTEALYNYDVAGDVTSWNHPAGFTITNTISNARRITKITSSVNDSTDPGTLAQNITYTAFGAVTGLQNGCVGSGCTNKQETYVYNNRLQMAVAEIGTSATHSADSCRVYNYYVGVANATVCSESTWPTGTNNNGDVAGYYYKDNVNTGLSHAAIYHYDGVNRLTTAAATGSSTYSQSFKYTGDGSSGQFGNMGCSASPAEVNCLAPTYYPATNQINYIPTNGVNTYYVYDAAGNLTGDGTHTYQWDAEERLKYVDGVATQPCPRLMSWTACNTYNALGQRVRDVTPTVTTDEYYGADGELLWRWTGSLANSSERAFVPFQGHTLAEYYGGSPGGTIFDHPDELGSLTTASDYGGNPLNERLYYPFGEFWNGASTPNLGIHQTFAQLPDYDSETDQYNTLNRHYTPMGRWMSPDPENAGADPSDPQTWNMYGYVRNNPTTNVDPDGLDCLYATQTATLVHVTVTAGSDCSAGQTYVPGTVDMSTVTFNGTGVGYGYTPYDTTQQFTYGPTIRPDPALTSNQVATLGSVYQQTNGPVNFFAGATLALSPFAVDTLIDSDAVPMSLGVEGQPVIGKMADLQELGEGERTLALPDQGSESANLTQNLARMEQEMSEGRPIKDATALKYPNDPSKVTGFYAKEVQVLKGAGWDLRNGYWYPPGK